MAKIRRSPLSGLSRFRLIATRSGRKKKPPWTRWIITPATKSVPKNGSTHRASCREDPVQRGPPS